MTAPRTGPALVFRPHGEPCAANNYVPGPQWRFLSWGGRDCFFGGAAGPGKSVCLIAAGLRRLALPNYRGKIFRRTRKMAVELIIKANRMVKRAFPGARYNGNENAFIHPNGGRLDIGYLRHDMDLENEEGQEYQFVGFDELCQFPEHQAKFLHGRLRSDFGLHLEYKGTGNPRGIGLLWVKNHYVDPAPPLTTHWHTFKTKDRQTGADKTFRTSTMFVPGRLEDNPSVGDDYEVSLASLGNPKLYEALRHGRWDALLGDAFPEWDPDQHVLTWAEFAMMHGLLLRVRPDGTEYCEIPDHWPIYMAYDWGTAAPFSVGWYTSDEHGRLYRIYEWYGAAKTREGATVRNQGIHMPTSQQAQGILAREERWGLAGRVEIRVADPMVHSDGNRRLDIAGPDIHEIMADEGVYLSKAQNSRLEGKAQYHERLRIAEFRNEDGTIDETPGFMVIRETNPEFLATVPILPTCPKNPEDVDKKAEAHAYDESRYMLMARPYRAKLEPVEATWLKSRRKRAKGDAV